MSEISVRPLGEEEWQDYRSVRLAALKDSPEAFVASYAEEEAYDEEFWRERMRRSTRLLAEVSGDAVGVLSIGQAHDGSENTGELFGLWVAPDWRGKGVATRLVTVGAEHARQMGDTHLIYWVGTDNGRAVAFASGIGFRPTDDRRPMGVQSAEDGDEEIAMILSLAEQLGPRVTV